MFKKCMLELVPSTQEWDQSNVDTTTTHVCLKCTLSCEEIAKERGIFFTLEKQQLGMKLDMTSLHW